MRQYLDKNKKTLEKVVCNCCGREMKLINGILQEGAFRGEACWGYFSQKDGERHLFDLCEECYDRLAAEFAVPVTIEEMTELL